MKIYIHFSPVCDPSQRVETKISFINRRFYVYVRYFKGDMSKSNDNLLLFLFFNFFGCARSYF